MNVARVNALTNVTGGAGSGNSNTKCRSVSRRVTAHYVEGFNLSPPHQDDTISTVSIIRYPSLGIYEAV